MGGRASPAARRIPGSSGRSNVAAETALRAAVRVARDQGARSLELRALLTLARLHDRRGQLNIARDELAALYERFTEGRDTADLLAAKSYLEGTSG